MVISWLKSLFKKPQKRDEVMRTSQRGIDLIKHFEGFSAKPYVCAGGKLTIGYGHVIKENEDIVEVDRTHAERLLRQDVAWAEDAVRRNVKVLINQNKFDALVSFVFNVGAGAFAKSTLLKELNQGHFIEASKQFLRWNKAGGKVLKGLETRRQAESSLFLLNR